MSTGIIAGLRDFARGHRPGNRNSFQRAAAVPKRIEAYWTSHNVTNHHVYRSVEESLEALSYRNDQYPYFAELMSAGGLSGQAVLDYGCGPGNDLVEIGLSSPGSMVTGVDVSPSSLGEAQHRLELHGLNARLMQVDPSPDRPLPFEDGEFDHVRSVGVIHHTADERRLLAELVRVLRPGGTMSIMVYNYDSIWLHLYVAYLKQVVERRYSGLSAREAFEFTTDGEDCPRAACYSHDEFKGICEDAGLRETSWGCYISAREMEWLSRRYEAIQQPSLAREHRHFLSSLTLDERGVPWWNGHVAGIGLCLHLQK